MKTAPRLHSALLRLRRARVMRFTRSAVAWLRAGGALTPRIRMASRNAPRETWSTIIDRPE